MPVQYDCKPRYTPEVVMTVKGKRPVVRAIAYPPNAHPANCPLVAGCVALELITDIGVSRWYGCQDAHIDSSLRMVVTGFPAAFEEMAAWPEVPASTLKTRAKAIVMCMCGAQATFTSKHAANKAGWYLRNPNADPAYEEAIYDRCPQCGLSDGAKGVK